MSESLKDLASRPEIIVSLFIAYWFVLMLLIARLTGWARLADSYQAATPFTGKRWRWQSIQTRWLTHYGNCVTIGANAEGLHVSLLFLFRIGHPQLFIPWREISVKPVKGWLCRGVELRFSGAPAIPVYISERLAQRIAAAAGGAWPGESFFLLVEWMM